MRRATFSQRLRYAFDNTMSAGSIALISWLAILSFALILVFSIITMALGQAPTDNFFEMLWQSLMRALDAGAVGGDEGWGFRILMLLLTFGGIFIVATLIGVLTSGIEEKLDELRKGRSFVVETDHTVILGWSPQIFAVISELVTANVNRPKAVIAILAEKDKVEMEDEIRARIEDTKTTRIVCRTGSPYDLSDLQIVNPQDARSIIILASEADDPDSLVIKTMLALVNSPNRPERPYHITAEIRDPANFEVAQMVANNEAQLIKVDEFISRVTVQTCRQSGLSVVYLELLDFGGGEIYFHEEPGLVGKPFADALLAYEDSAVLGMRFADGRVALSPPMDTLIQRGDELVAVSQDDDTIRLSGRSDLGIDASAIVDGAQREAKPERTLILGWNTRGIEIIRELDHYVAPGSEVTVVADSEGAEEQASMNSASLANQRVIFQNGHITDRRLLDSLSVCAYDHIITLSYSDTLENQQADAQTLITLLHLRDISEKQGQPIAIVSEMLDMRNRKLAEVARADDFIVSDKLISLMISQVSENKDLMAVFQDLFDPEGVELYLKYADEYVKPGVPVNFYTVVEAARRRGEIALGYRKVSLAGDASQAYGVAVNPPKSKSVSFDPKDRIVVLAENEKNSA
ncbi:MAG: NAD-binding protein [Nitrococcus sp.]|nr:NAD-binding protein [Nitrococcus sp.]